MDVSYTTVESIVASNPVLQVTLSVDTSKSDVWLLPSQHIGCAMPVSGSTWGTVQFRVPFMYSPEPVKDTRTWYSPGCRAKAVARVAIGPCVTAALLLVNIAWSCAEIRAPTGL
jgi:hypothetical protein